MALKFNIEPYFDDFLKDTGDGFTPQEKYYKVLFRPGEAVQARELTQLQSIIQNQVSQFGKHMFQEGAMVIPGGFSINKQQPYVKLASFTATESELTGIIGDTIEGAASGVKAKIVHIEPSDGGDPATLYVNYINSGTDNTTKVFYNNEGLTFTTNSGESATTSATDATGLGSTASINRGVYFIKDHFVIVKASSIVLDKYDITPTYDVGLSITETIQTPAGDVTLNDNAQGTPNYAAPGAHRYEIKTKLVKQDIDAEASIYSKFQLLGRVEYGIINFQVRSTDYAVIEETFARRTFDESGNYTVRPFPVTMKEHTDVYTPGDDTKLVAAVEPSKAYVLGYEIETLATTFVDVPKARDTAFFESASVTTPVGNYIEINNLVGLPDLNKFGSIELRDGTGGAGSIIGTCRARTIQRSGSNYLLYLFDVKMTATNAVFSSVKSIKSTATDPDFGADVVLQGGFAVIQQPLNNSMIFPLPFKRIETMEDENKLGGYNFVYFSNRKYPNQTVSSGTISFGAGTATSFEPFDQDNYILMVVTGPSTGTIVSLSNSDVLISGAGNDTITVSNLGAYDGQDVSMVVGIRRTLEHALKSIPGSGGVPSAIETISSQLIIESGDIRLDKADGYKLIKVYMSPDFATAPVTTHTDVTQYYRFDDGQRENYYDVCSIKVDRSTGFNPTGQLLIHYDFFEHNVTGDFFTVNSYDSVTDYNDVSLAYEDIPTFNSSKHGSVELRSCLDFRPRMNNGGGSFSGTGSKVTLCPEPATTMSTDIHYYLNRIDKVYLDKDGKFGVTTGVSALEPKLPSDPKDAMVLYNLFVNAYTEGPNEVTIEVIDNKRYTMRDIGKLERRINNLEYYTSLSLLETEAQQKQIPDVNGIDRFKNGFLVDAFANHTTSDTRSREFRSGIDRANRTLRPLFAEKNVGMHLQTIGSTDYQKTGDLITLPYTTGIIAGQPLASGKINVNPYDVFNWTGTLEITPSNDEWRASETRPNVIVDQEGVYDAMLDIINETDAIGTVWNNWQTNWTGSTDSSSSSTRGRRTNTTTVTTTTRNQTRSGIETAVVPDTITTELGERVVEVNFIPFMRGRVVRFKGTRLKPGSRLYPFFDGRDVSAYVKPITSGQYTTASNFNPFVTVDGSGIPNGSANGTGNGLLGHPDGAGSIVSNASGEIYGEFVIPNNSTLRFATGSRLFQLVDDPTNTETNITTQASTSYSARGMMETKENVTLSTRIPNIERREVSDNRVVTSTSSRTTSVFAERPTSSGGSAPSRGWTAGNPVGPGWWDRFVSWVDPLAQSFLLNIKGGAMITGIDVFFASKDPNIPVTLQIREMSNGIPTPFVLPFAEVTLNPTSVSVDPNSPTAATHFAFESPVHVQDGTEYCFVVMANSTEYEVWYAGIGEDAVPSGQRISKNPYAGVLFLSQNASTWTPDQNKDMKFDIHRAIFDTTKTGVVILENDYPANRQLINNPFKTLVGSNRVRVSHSNHGLFRPEGATSYVDISGVSGPVNGIPAIDLNGIHPVSDVEQDSYVITVTTNATSTGLGGQSTVVASENMSYNVLYPIINEINFPRTNTTWSIKTTTGVSLTDSASAPYVQDTEFSPIIVNQNYPLDKLKTVNSIDNDAGATSLTLRAQLTSGQDNISPMIDLERCSVIGVQNRIDRPSGIYFRSVVQSGTSGIGTGASFDISISSTTYSVASVILGGSGYVGGDTITIDGTAIGGQSGVNDLTFTVAVSGSAVTSVNTLTGTALSASSKNVVEDFVSEYAQSGGSALAKYVTKNVILNEPCTTGKVYLDINKPTGTFVDVYYKIGTTEEEMVSSDWKPIAPDEPIPTSEDPSHYKETSYEIDEAIFFNAIKMKIVMTSTNPAKVPTCKALRVIVLA